MRILVTGGAGYIGSHVARALDEAGHTPVVYDNLSRGNLWAVRWGPFYEADLLNEELLFHTLRSERIEAVIHLAALAYVGESMQDASRYFTTNVQGSLTLLRAMKRAGVRQLVFSSTCAVYGEPESLPLTEASPLKPCNPYSESKRIVEQFLRWFGETEGFRWVALRYFNAAGADPSDEIGEWHQPETHLIPSLLGSLLEPDKVCTIHGNDYPTPDGTAIRDYVHVADLADAHLRALTWLNRGGANTHFNLGTGHGHSIGEILTQIERHSGRAVPHQFGPRRPGDPPKLVASSQRSKEMLAWIPQHSSLDQIIATAWQWTQKIHSPLFRLALSSSSLSRPLTKSKAFEESSSEVLPPAATSSTTRP